MKFDPPNKEFLVNEYLVNKKCMKQISKESGYAVGTIYNYLKKYGIESRHMTEETKRKLSLAMKGKPGPNKGKKCSLETKEKIRKARLGKYTKPTPYGGHRKKRSDGYIKVFVPNHPYSTKDGYVMEHILVVEKHIGRYITRNEVVHHINHIRDDNRLENLKLMTFKEHAAFHMKERHEQRKKEVVINGT